MTADDAEIYTLYRNSVTDVACPSTFDTDDGTDYNAENCAIADLVSPDALLV
jgi:hypothetical protein